MTECDVSHSKYHNFWTTAPISVKKLQNVALVAGFYLHSFSSLNSQKREFYGHFTGAHLFKKIAIFESTMKQTSAVHTYLNCIYSHGGLTFACFCLFRMVCHLPVSLFIWYNFFILFLCSWVQPIYPQTLDKQNWNMCVWLNLFPFVCDYLIDRGENIFSWLA